MSSYAPPAPTPQHDERVDPSDLAMLAMDARAAVHQHLGALVMLRPSPGFDIEAAQRLLADRAGSVPRLRQRIVPARPGRRGAMWSEDGSIDVARHVRRVHCPEPGDERAMLDIAAATLVEPFPAGQPLWRAVFVTGAAGGGVGVVLALHHCLADGTGGLAVLERLLDPDDGSTADPAGSSVAQRAGSADRPGAGVTPHRPTRWTELGRAARELRTSFAAVGGLRGERAEPCSLLATTGRRRRFATADAELAPMRAAAHRDGATVNDALLAVVSAALGALLERRGELVRTLRVAVPVAVPRPGPVAGAGNAVAPMVIGIRTGSGLAATVRAIALTVTEVRRRPTAPAPIVLLGPVFRLLAAAGLYHWYMNRQRRFHTLVSNVRGPDRPVALSGAPVERIVPLAVGEAGNTTVNFLALSYAGRLTITVVADPDRVPDLVVLADAVRAELDALG
jgi:WS/DGAT/MGAT family acyltransferase